MAAPVRCAYSLRASVGSTDVTNLYCPTPVGPAHRGRSHPVIPGPRERHRQGTGGELSWARAVCVLTRALPWWLRLLFEPSPHHTLSRGAFSASSLVRPTR